MGKALWPGLGTPLPPPAHAGNCEKCEWVKGSRTALLWTLRLRQNSEKSEWVEPQDSAISPLGDSHPGRGSPRETKAFRRIPPQAAHSGAFRAILAGEDPPHGGDGFPVVKMTTGIGGGSPARGGRAAFRRKRRIASHSAENATVHKPHPGRALRIPHTTPLLPKRTGRDPVPEGIKSPTA